MTDTAKLLEGYTPTIITIEPYEMDVTFVWSPDEQQALARYFTDSDDKRWKEWGPYIADTEWNCRGMSWVGSLDVPAVVGVNLPLFYSGEDGQMMFRNAMGTLAHEIFHIIMALSKNIGENPEYGHEEPMAYQTGFLMRRGLELLAAECPNLHTMVDNAAK